MATAANSVQILSIHNGTGTGTETKYERVGDEERKAATREGVKRWGNVRGE